MQAHHIQAIKEITPERAFLDGQDEVPVGGGHEAHVHRDDPVAADLGDLALLHGPQELGLDLEGNVADFVKKQGAVLAYGNFITLSLNFLIIAFVLFIVIRLMNQLKRLQEAAPTAPPKPSREEELLTEIRDLLKKA